MKLSMKKILFACLAFLLIFVSDLVAQSPGTLGATECNSAPFGANFADFGGLVTIAGVPHAPLCVDIAGTLVPAGSVIAARDIGTIGQVIAHQPQGKAPIGGVVSTTPVNVMVLAKHTLGFSCGVTTTCANTAILNEIQTIGRVTLAAGTATVTGMPFANVNAVCAVQDRTAVAAARCIVATAGTTLVCTGTATDVLDYSCWGT
jgi:hypothetical protein